MNISIRKTEIVFLAKHKSLLLLLLLFLEIASKFSEIITKKRQRQVTDRVKYAILKKERLKIFFFFFCKTILFTTIYLQNKVILTC